MNVLRRSADWGRGRRGEKRADDEVERRTASGSNTHRARRMSGKRPLAAEVPVTLFRGTVVHCASRAAVAILRAAVLGVSASGSVLFLSEAGPPDSS